MTLHAKDIAECLLRDLAISEIVRYGELSRLLPHVTVRQFTSGEIFYRLGDDADSYYLLHSGSISTTSGVGECLLSAGNHFGAEAGTDLESYRGEARAVTDGCLIVIPREKIQALMASKPELKSKFYFSLMDSMDGNTTTLSGSRSQFASPGIDKLKTFAWIASILLPALILISGDLLGLDRNALFFLSIFTATILMWGFSLVDEYVPGLLALMAALATGVAPAKVVLSGFTSDGFFMAMSLLGLGFIIVVSGLGYRVMLLCLKYLPHTQFWQNIAILLTGFLLTPLIPSTNSRIALMTPFYTDMTETLRVKPGGRASTRLAISMFTGASLMSAVFLSSKSINFVVLGLLPAQTQLQFQWLNWLIASLATGIGMLLIYLVLSAIMLRNDEQQSLSADLIKTQLQLLGRLKNRERLAIAGMALFGVGVVTSAFHKIEPVWIGLGVLLIFLLIGTLNKREFREKIDWPFLFYLAETIGIINVFNYVGLNTWISKGLSAIGLERLLATNLSLFILALSGIILLLRFLLPINATVVILATIFIPLADNIGFNTWIMGFIILLLGEMWIFPYQCSYYIQFRTLTKQFAMYDEQAFLRFNLWSNVLKIAVVYLSIPFWKLLGLL